MRERILNILIKACEEIKDNPDADLIAEEYIDSLEIVNIVMDLEDEFGIEIDPEDVIPENFGTVDKIVDFISRMTEV